MWMLYVCYFLWTLVLFVRMEHNVIGHACIGGAIAKANAPQLLTTSHRDSPRQRATCWNVGMLDNWKFQ